jgi:hypothetical protein
MPEKWELLNAILCNFCFKADLFRDENEMNSSIGILPGMVDTPIIPINADHDARR